MDPTAGSDTITVTASDITSASSANPVTIAVTINWLPVTTAPTSATVQQNQANPISDVSLSESGDTEGVTFTIHLSAMSGLLAATEAGVSGSGTTSLTISGSLSQVNVDLATLTDTEASTAPATIRVAANDSFGNVAASQAIPITVTPPSVTNLFDFVFTYNDGKDYYNGTVADNGSFGYFTNDTFASGAGTYDIFSQTGTTTAAPGTVSVT
jgi:hypothetical protein